MKKKTISLLAFTLFSASRLLAQGPQIQTETWIDKPIIKPLDVKFSKESAIILLDKRRVEFTDEAKNTMAEYYTSHKIVHINDDRGIEYYNKIYLGVSENADIVTIRGRTILPGGRIIELDKSNIKDIKEENGNVYKIFAMEGLEKGCEIEYYYTYKRPVSWFGREVVQEVTPELETTFQLIAPARLRFDIKAFNFGVTPHDTVINERRVIECSFKGTPGVDEEKYAAYQANLRKLEFKLSYNDLTRKGERLFTWNELAKRIYGVYTLYNEKEIKKVADLVTANGWSTLTDEAAKITAVESYIKTKFSYDENLESDDGNRLAGVLQNKIGGAIGTMRLYSAIFQNLGVRFQYVLTGNREKFVIDREFENWNNCDNPMFYFPDEGKFIAPTRPDYRYPWIFPSWGGTNGLFCKTLTIGSLTTAIAEIRDISLEEYKKSTNNIEARLELSHGLDSLAIDEKQIYTGYSAAGFRDALNYSNNEQRTNIVKELTKSMAGTDHILFSEVLNPEFDKANTNQPLILHTKTKSSDLVETAGNKLLLKIGLAIGPQVEMYQEKPRVEPVDIEFGHIEERKIDFVIPDGYTITNPDDLKISQTYSDGGELTMGFVSAYEIKGNILSVHIIEEYRKTYYPLSQFEQFRKIINASSDFNKVVLVLEKKG